MHFKKSCLIPLLLASSGGFADQLALEDAAKQLMKDSATAVVPAASAETLDSANQSVEKAKNLKESMERAPATVQAPPGGEAGQSGGAKPDPAKKATATPEEPKASGTKAAERPRAPRSKRQHR